MTQQSQFLHLIDSSHFYSYTLLSLQHSPISSSFKIISQMKTQISVQEIKKIIVVENSTKEINVAVNVKFWSGTNVFIHDNFRNRYFVRGDLNSDLITGRRWSPLKYRLLSSNFCFFVVPV